jgi:hypothetical protein
MRMLRLAGVHLACAIVVFYLCLHFGASLVGMEEPSAGKGNVIVWIGIAALLARSIVLVMLQHTRFRARVEELTHPVLVLGFAGAADGLLLIPLFAFFAHFYYAGAANPAVESIFLVLIGPVALLAAIFPLAVNLGLRRRLAMRGVRPVSSK